MPYGGQLAHFRLWHYSDFVRGKGLYKSGRYLVYTKSEKLLGATDDIKFALAWRTAAALRKVIVTVEDSA